MTAKTLCCSLCAGVQITGSLMKLFSFIIFIPLQIAFIPLMMVGILLTAYKQIIVSKRLGVSQTAIEIINGRWTMHIFGLRQDNATAALMAVLPNTSRFGLLLVLLLVLLRCQLWIRLMAAKGLRILSILQPLPLLHL